MGAFEEPHCDGLRQHAGTQQLETLTANRIALSKLLNVACRNVSKPLMPAVSATKPSMCVGEKARIATYDIWMALAA